MISAKLKKRGMLKARPGICEPERLVLGTVQLGMDYGIANEVGQPDVEAAEKIVKSAWEGGVRQFDTAQGYGRSEPVLGEVFGRLGIADKAEVISKFNPQLDHLDYTVLKGAMKKSLSDLKVKKLYGVMLHSEELLDQWDQGVGENLVRCREEGLAQRLGVSVYSPERARRALETEEIELIQLPSNILDRRFERAGVFELAEELGKTIYVRSVFLQGLLLMEPGELSEAMAYAKPVVERYVTLAEWIGLGARQLALGYVQQAYPGARIVFGAEQGKQVKDNLRDWQYAIASDVMKDLREKFDGVEEQVLNPALWPRE